MTIALSISDDLADFLNRSRRVTVQNGVPSARASGLDMSVVVVEEDDLMRLNAQQLPRQVEDRRIGLGQADLVGVDDDVYELLEAKAPLLFTARAIGRVAQNGRGIRRT